MRYWLPFSLLALALIFAGCVQPEVKEVKASWGEINDQYSELLVTVSITNPLPFLPLKDVESYVYVNGIQIAEGNAKDIEKDRLVLSIKIQNDRIRDFWVSHLQNGERSEMVIRVVPVINLLITEYRYPIEMKDEFVTDILGMRFPDQSVTVAGKEVFAFKNIHLELGKVNNLETQILVKGTAINNAPVSLEVRRMEYRMLMNGIEVAGGTENLNLNLKAGGRSEVSIPVVMDNTKLPEWWVTHVRNGEHTKVKIQAKLYIEFMGIEYPLDISQETEFSTSLAGSVKI